MRGLLIDTTKCIGCGACSAGCREQNGLAETDAPDLNDRQFTVIKKATVAGQEVNYRRLCMQCMDPTCVSVCPVGALEKTKLGPVSYDADKCLGCRYCMQACPYSIPRYEWNSLNPRIRKCGFCEPRLQKGQPNACAEACPTGATIAGDRDQLLAEAHSRLAQNPRMYVQQVYGEHEAGGASVFFLSAVPFDKLGFPSDLPGQALPILTYQVLSKIPAIVGTGGMTLSALWWLTKRKQEVARVEGKEGNV